MDWLLVRIQLGLNMSHSSTGRAVIYVSCKNRKWRKEMANFAKVVKNNQYQNLTRTENQAVALKSTGSALLDFFASVGAMRSEPELTIVNKFEKAFAEDKLLAMKTLFYARNIRGGLGERRAVRIILRYLGDKYPDIAKKNFPYIPCFGRWDDFYYFVGTEIEEDMFRFIHTMFMQDLSVASEGGNITLLAKWLKSVNTSSEESRALGKKTAKAFGMSEKTYRKALSKLRKHLKVVERKMSANKWEEINYEQVPSYAMKNYRKAFWRHDEDGFSSYLESVEKGEKGIKSGTLYPYDLLMAGKLSNSYNGFWGDSDNFFTLDNWDRILQQQWEALPNYIEGENNILVMADTSASMQSVNGRPLATSLGLAIYFAERNKGAYENLFMTFSTSPRFVELSGNTLPEKVKGIESIVADTNLEKAFELILEVALTNKVAKEDMPKALIVISDMQFNRCVQDSRQLATFHEKMNVMFSRYGYKLPKVVYWNVEERRDSYQVHEDSPNVYLVSGQSPSTFKNVINITARTPYDLMLEVLNDPLYDCVKI